MKSTAIVIPSYEPDERLISLINDLIDADIGPIYVVNDGSGNKFDDIFDKIEFPVCETGGKILKHEVNRGKGRALKTAFEYILDNNETVQSIVTADCDGQHSCACIKRIADAGCENRDCLILGVRSFDKGLIPWRSKFGNIITQKVFKYITGTNLSDTQTGLRAIPRNYLPEIVKLKGNRYEFEMEMLVNAVKNLKVIEVPIQTIYDSADNHQTHFNTIKDSFRIYRVLCKTLFKYILSSVSSCLLDLTIFGIMCHLLKHRNPVLYVAFSTAIARVISATYNYAINYKFVFKSRENVITAAFKYISLAIIQMSCSALFVTALVTLCPNDHELVFKVVVDTILFFISYVIQRRFIF